MWWRQHQILIDRKPRMCCSIREAESSCWEASTLGKAFPQKVSLSKRDIPRKQDVTGNQTHINNSKTRAQNIFSFSCFESRQCIALPFHYHKCTWTGSWNEAVFNVEEMLQQWQVMLFVGSQCRILWSHCYTAPLPFLKVRHHMVRPNPWIHNI